MPMLPFFAFRYPPEARRIIRVRDRLPFGQPRAAQANVVELPISDLRMRERPTGLASGLEYFCRKDPKPNDITAEALGSWIASTWGCDDETRNCCCAISTSRRHPGRSATGGRLSQVQLRCLHAHTLGMPTAEYCAR